MNILSVDLLCSIKRGDGNVLHKYMHRKVEVAILTAVGLFKKINKKHTQLFCSHNFHSPSAISV